jgi:hypothetical protein
MEANKFLLSNYNTNNQSQLMNTNYNTNNQSQLMNTNDKELMLYKTPNKYNNNEDDEMDNTFESMKQKRYLSSNKIDPFAGREQSYNKEFYNVLLKQFDKTFLSKIVDMHNALGKHRVDLNEIENLLEFFEHYRSELRMHYLYSLIFPERSKNVRIPTKFPIPSFTFLQKSNFTITANGSGNFYLQWVPQTLLSSAYTTANNGNCLLNTSSAITGSAADTTTTNYTSITSDRLLNATLIQAYRLVSASLIVKYVGSVDAHSGILGGGVDISYIDSLLPDTASGVFNVIDDKIWSIQSNPYEGLRLIYFPKDFGDLNFIRPDVGTQSNGLSTCVRLLVYGQNIPAGATIRVELFRNFEAIPYPGNADFFNVDFFKPSKYHRIEKMQIQSSGEPALDAGSLISENGVAATKVTDEDKLEKWVVSGGNSDFKNMNNLPNQVNDDDDEMVKNNEQNESRGFFGTILDIATGLGKTLIGEALNQTIGRVPFIGGLITNKLKTATGL